MLDIFKNFFPAPNKNLEIPSFLGIQEADSPVYTPASFSRYYQTNPIAFKCVDVISSGLSNIQIDATDIKTDNQIDNHPFLSFLKRPNPRDTQSRFFYRWSTYHLVYGQSFILKTVGSGNEVIELNLVNPLNVTIEEDGSFYPRAYLVNEGKTQKRYLVDQTTGLAIPEKETGIGKTFLYQVANADTDNSLNGLSRMEIAAYAIDSFTFGMSWNRNLLQNNARPSMILTSHPGTMITAEQKQELKEMIREYQGHKNASKTLVLNGFTTEQASLNPTDMDFREMLNKMAEYIAAAFGVPPLLVNPVGSTFNNMAETKITLYRDTILPLMTQLLESLSLFVEPEYPRLLLGYNEDSINALWEERRIKLDSMTKAVGQQILTQDEGRTELGYEEIGEGSGADTLYIRSGSIPLELAGEMPETGVNEAEPPIEEEEPKEDAPEEIQE